MTILNRSIEFKNKEQERTGTIKEAFEIVHRIRMHVKKDDCQCCKDALI
jgi:hypothetical protein